MVLTRVFLTTFRPPSHFPSEVSGLAWQNFLREGVRLTIFGPEGLENRRRRRRFRKFWQIFEKKVPLTFPWLNIYFQNLISTECLCNVPKRRNWERGAVNAQFVEAELLARHLERRGFLFPINRFPQSPVYPDPFLIKICVIPPLNYNF